MAVADVAQMLGYYETHLVFSHNEDAMNGENITMGEANDDF